jgi:hypothetical protein
MAIEFIEHGGNQYPYWQATGNAARWIMQLAMEVCKPFEQKGCDIGCNNPEWALPGSVQVDPEYTEYDADNLPYEAAGYSYLFSSHMLEHYKGNWMSCLDHWIDCLKDGGVLFLYLPHSSQTYWHPSINRKHVHSFDGSEIKLYLESLGYSPYLTPVDYNNSFAVICYKEKIRPAIKVTTGSEFKVMVNNGKIYYGENAMVFLNRFYPDFPSTQFQQWREKTTAKSTK